jgi:glycosyltransferase involved in cell wall biosynthesis
MYLTWGETPRSYGVFGSQVIGQFVQTKKLLPEAEFMFVSGVPVVHSGLVREKLGYFDELKKVKDHLGEIYFHWVPIWITQNFVTPSRRTFKWLFFGACGRLKHIIKEFKPQIVHCRSYGAAWVALQVRKASGCHYRIIFDARGLMPEEVAFKRDYSEDSADYIYLKQIESILLNECDLTVAVSDTMGKHYKALGARDLEVVYLSANYDKLNAGKKNIKPTGGPLKFCYVGALTEFTWHRPAELSKLFNRLKKVFPDSKLVIISTSNHESIMSHFSDWDECDITIDKSYTVDTLASHLQNADFGLMSYFCPTSPRELKLADMVMAVKVAEYLCAGLPVILNKYCGGAADVVERHDMGVVYDPNHLESLDTDKIRRLANDGKARERISAAAEFLFDYQVHAQQYVDIYRRFA